jgi:hypothetical protein
MPMPVQPVLWALWALRLVFGVKTQRDKKAGDFRECVTDTYEAERKNNRPQTPAFRGCLQIHRPRVLTHSLFIFVKQKVRCSNKSNLGAGCSSVTRHWTRHDLFFPRVTFVQLSQTTLLHAPRELWTMDSSAYL